jgi:hypothetical protein
MKDEPGPTRRVFGFEPREFVRANRPPGEPRRHDTPANPGAESNPDSEKPIDVRDMARIASGDGSPLRTPPPADRKNEVHGILRFNLERDQARGWYDVEPGTDKKRRRRIRNYVIALLAINTPLGLIAWLSGHTDPFPFVSAIAGMAFLSARVTWETWFLRTD